jgi:hypothetical protein
LDSPGRVWKAEDTEWLLKLSTAKIAEVRGKGKLGEEGTRTH